MLLLEIGYVVEYAGCKQERHTLAYLLRKNCLDGTGYCKETNEKTKSQDLGGDRNEGSSRNLSDRNQCIASLQFCQLILILYHSTQD